MRTVSEYVKRFAFQTGATNAHGNPVEAWASVGVQVGIYVFDPGSSSEPRDGGDRVIVEPTIYCPPGSVFDSRDRVECRGELFEVEGVPRVWNHPTAGPRGVVVSLRRVTG